MDGYADPGTFFAQTYPSEGLRTLLNEALGRLLGTRPDAASVLRLETAFGGGKTHNLIARTIRLSSPKGSNVMSPAASGGRTVEPVTEEDF